MPVALVIHIKRLSDRSETVQRQLNDSSEDSSERVRSHGSCLVPLVPRAIATLHITYGHTQAYLSSVQDHALQVTGSVVLGVGPFPVPSLSARGDDTL